MNKSKISLVVEIVCILTIAHATLSPNTDKGPKNKVKKTFVGPLKQTVFERNLVVSNPTAKEIIKNYEAYYKEVNKVNLDGISLGYVTPWNNHGYDVAKIFAAKFTHISPVWLQVKRNGKLSYEVTGTQDIDKNWMKEVLKSSNKKRQVKMVPRILLEGWQPDDYRSLFQSKEEVAALSKTLASSCTSLNFHGFVLEGWSQLFGYVPLDPLTNVLKLIASSLEDVGCQTILVLPPKQNDDKISSYTKTVFDELYNVVTAFSLMTYDFSSVQRPGPNAPIQWVNQSINFLSPKINKREKILTGLNFYGNAYTVNGGDSIVAHRYLELLRKFKGKIPYDSDSAENYFEIKDDYDRSIVFYPTLHSINERIKLIKELGTGVSVWELGQGLDYFYDLL